MTTYNLKATTQIKVNHKGKTDMVYDEVDIEITAEEIQKLIAENPEILEVKKDGKPEHGTRYWFISSLNSIGYDIWTNYNKDNYRRNLGNFFLIENECNAQQEKNEATARVLGYIRDNELGKEHYEDDNNHCITEDMNKLCVASCWNRNFLPPLGYFISEEACKQVIDNNRADLKLIYGIK